MFPLTNMRQQRILYFCAWILLLGGLYFSRAILLPFLLASLLAYVFHPIVKLLEQIKILNKPLPRALSIVIIYILFAVIFTIISFLFIPQFYREMTKLAQETTILLNQIDEDSITQWSKKLNLWLKHNNIPLDIIYTANSGPKHHFLSINIINTFQDLVTNFVSYLKSESKNIISNLNYILSQAISFLFLLLLIFMITAFILIDTNRIKNFAFSLMPIKNQKNFDKFLAQVDIRLSGVVRGQLLICLVNAILTLIGLLAFKIKFAFILATIAGIFSIIPIFGSIMSTIPIVLVSLTISPIKALLALLWILAIHALEANLLNPKIMGDSAKIHPALIILFLLAGKHYYGITGALLSIPIFSILITLFSSILAKAKDLDEGVAKPQ